jgi:hypothetical protein
MSENVLLAQTFLTDYIATEEAMLALYEADPRGSAYLPAAAQIDDPYLNGIAAAGENAVPMPAIPAMGKVWGDWGNALTSSSMVPRPPKSLHLSPRKPCGCHRPRYRRHGQPARFMAKSRWV